MPATFTLSAFGDEIDKDLSTQVALLKQLDVHYLEFRSAWGVNVKDLDMDQIARVRQICADADMSVSCIGSPIGKTTITLPLENEVNTLNHVLRVCDALGTRNIRIFAFYPSDKENKAAYDSFVPESIARLSSLVELAAREGCTLMLENDEDLVADNLERTHAILSSIDSPHLRFAWDNANFVRSGVVQPTTNGWARLSPYIGTAHIKDARLDRSQRAAGEGDGEISLLLQMLYDRGYQGFLAVEPHPFVVDGRGELRGAEGMTYAVGALRRLLTPFQM